MRISDWSSDVCSSDLLTAKLVDIYRARGIKLLFSTSLVGAERDVNGRIAMELSNGDHLVADALMFAVGRSPRSEEHTSELHSLLGSLYHVFCLNQTNVRRKIDTVEAAAKAAGIMLGGIPPPERSAKDLYPAGYDLLPGGMD